ncbi:putative SWI/SNF-related matrix-associated actin-dependent regulator of chromatin subfamily A member 3-like protein 3 [Tanacetum coccineum]
MSLMYYFLEHVVAATTRLVLLMSIKAGGVGLNLTATSNVFLMDTVEERMQQVQARKQRMIAGALTDEEVRSARLEELKMLFR